MTDAAPRLLFIPVSGPRGMGEFGRATAMAEAVSRRWPGAVIHFALSREAPYAASLRHPATLLPSSATFHTQQIVDLIRGFRPDVVVFDNAGRTAQLRAARAAGARVVFVSARSRQRRKAFRVRWMRLIDEHWIAYPRFLAGAPGLLERVKLRLVGRPRLRYLDPVLPPPDAGLARALLDGLDLRAREYVVVVPGGGTVHRGTEGAMAAIASSARHLAARGIDTVAVGLEVSGVEDDARLRAVPRLPLTELAELLRNARLAIVNGGYTLLQALAAGQPTVAVPLAPDQRDRIRRCAAAGLAVEGEPEPAALARQAMALLDDESRIESLARARASTMTGSGAAAVVAAFEELLRA